RSGLTDLRDSLQAILDAESPQKAEPPRTQATSLLIEIERARSLGVPI
ncbi:MAG: hypothetical protein IT189_09265, partial [Microbacteriaceae bacterium]|nr:hypothetical protein [Microbacteriaceae bacterium]